MIEEKFSEKVLTVGPEYQDHRGGIGAVIATYQTFFEKFKFIPTYKYHSGNIRKILFYMGRLFSFFNILRNDKKIEIVHIHGSHGGSFYRKLIMLWVAKNIYHKKVIYHIHSGMYADFYNNSFRIQKRLIRWAISKADLIICLSTYWKSYFEETFKIMNIEVVHNVVPEPGNKDISSYNFDTGKINFIFLGLVGDNKGVFDILKVISSKREFLKNKIKFFIGGNGEIKKLSDFINERQLNEFVFYKGWLNEEQKRKLLQGGHIFILPSYKEGMPVSVLEAMSYQLPIISSPVGGIPEIVKDGINGLLVEPGNLKEIEKAMLFFINDPDKIQLFGQHSLRLVDPYLPSTVTGQLRDIYTELL